MSQKIENGQITRLVWEINTFPNYIDEGDKLLSAKTPFGFYKIMDKRPYGLSGFSYFGPYSEAHSLEDENAAKAAAEDDYEMRILSAITQQPKSRALSDPEQQIQDSLDRLLMSLERFCRAVKYSDELNALKPESDCRPHDMVTQDDFRNLTAAFTDVKRGRAGLGRI